MPVLSAVLTLPTEPRARAAALDGLRGLPGLSLGVEHAGGRLPVVLESSSRAEDKALWEAVSAVPQLLHVELVFADFSDLDDTGGPPPRRRSSDRHSPALLSLAMDQP